MTTHTAKMIKKSDLSLKDLAAAAGVSYQVARRWSLGESEPKFPHQVAGLARALRCKPADLIPDGS